jgi:hypothetical protein
MTTSGGIIDSVSVVKNQDCTEFGSDLLNEVAELGASAYDSTADKTTMPVSGKKGEIITALVIHLAGDVIFELLKLAAKRLQNHPEYDSLISLNINGLAVTLRDVADEQ